MLHSILQNPGLIYCGNPVSEDTIRIVYIQGPLCSNYTLLLRGRQHSGKTTLHRYSCNNVTAQNCSHSHDSPEYILLPIMTAQIYLASSAFIPKTDSREDASLTTTIYLLKIWGQSISFLHIHIIYIYSFSILHCDLRPYRVETHIVVRPENLSNGETGQYLE